MKTYQVAPIVFLSKISIKILFYKQRNGLYIDPYWQYWHNAVFMSSSYAQIFTAFPINKSHQKKEHIAFLELLLIITETNVINGVTREKDSVTLGNSTVCPPGGTVMLLKRVPFVRIVMYYNNYISVRLLIAQAVLSCLDPTVSPISTNKYKLNCHKGLWLKKKSFSHAQRSMSNYKMKRTFPLFVFDLKGHCL